MPSIACLDENNLAGAMALEACLRRVRLPGPGILAGPGRLMCPTGPWEADYPARLFSSRPIPARRRKEGGGSGLMIGGERREGGGCGLMIGGERRNSGGSGLMIGGERKEGGGSGLMVGGERRNSGGSGLMICVEGGKVVEVA